MKVLADLHHFDLYHSFQIIFDKLGWALYRPIGGDWLYEDFWALSQHQPVVDCYLSREKGGAQKVMSQFPVLDNPEWARYGIEMLRIGDVWDLGAGLFRVEDLSKGTYQNACTLDAFKSLKFDIIISSLPQHFSLFENLRKKYAPQAKHIYHMGPGNVEWEVPEGAQNLLLHTPPKGEYLNRNYCFYRQPFDLNIFSFTEPFDKRYITSYVHFPESEAIMNQVATYVSSCNFNFVGKTLGPTKDVIIKTFDLAEKIKNSAFTWHIKPGGESYGHIIHNTFACGRPPIVNTRDYKDKMAGALMEDMVTCICSRRTPYEIAKCIDQVLEGDKHKEMCKKAHERFCDVVDFDKEQKDIEAFLGRLQ